MKTKKSGTPPLEPRERRKRRRELTFIAVLTTLFVLLSVAEIRLSTLSTTLPFVNSIFFFGLLNINLIILVGVVWLVFRNVGKVFLERRRRVLGSALKSKLVVAFLGFSVIPTLILFAISAAYINSSFDKWFSIKVQNTLQASLDITRAYYRSTDQSAMHFAVQLAASARRLLASGARPAALAHHLEEQRALLALDAVEYYPDLLDERLLVSRPGTEGDPVHYPRLSLDLLRRAQGGERVSVVEHVGSGDLIRCLVPVARGVRPGVGLLVVNAYIPVSLVNKVDEVASVFDDYKDVNPLKYPMKTMYLVILVMITLVVLFVAIWFGLYLARQLTEPIQKLVIGAEEVGRGNLDVTIPGSGQDEIRVLVDSFNRMTHDLRDNRERLQQASADLEKRRLQLEAVLANVGTGVIVVDRQGQITVYNRAVSGLLQSQPAQMLGRSYRDALLGPAEPLVAVIDEVLSTQLPASAERLPEVVHWNCHGTEGESRALSAVVTPLRDVGGELPWGAVVVIDDMTALIKAQRETAWREVARRIAHEIKNPLTPIKLSAQRLQRRLSDIQGRDGELLRECTDTIVRHTDELKEMVNEFSAFARFPEVSPAPSDLNEAAREVVRLYETAHPSIQFELKLEPRMPIFEFDRDQIKRVLINLLDNAVTVLSQVPRGSLRRVTLESHHHLDLQMAFLSVQDTGRGMNDEVRSRVFEPYFSTRKEGTGLGLAICKRIVNDHDGFIRVSSAPGQGTQFTIELPTSIRHKI